jgi:phosphopantetheinyl transferase
MKNNDRIILSARRIPTLDSDATSAALARITLLFGNDYAASLNKKNPQARNDSLAGALLLADMAEILGVGGKILRNSYQKPYFEKENAHFSISHDGGFAVCALSLNCRVGVDISQLPCKLDADSRRSFAVRYFTSYEAQLPADTADGELFASLWAKREAVGKLEGNGVTPFLRKPIPSDKYTFENFYLYSDKKCGFISLCHESYAPCAELLPLDKSVFIKRK